jgi:hypothetical protein
MWDFISVDQTTVAVLISVALCSHFFVFEQGKVVDDWHHGGRPKFTKNCEAYLKMVEMLASGEIDPGEPPRMAYQRHPLFQLHDANAFRAGF